MNDETQPQVKKEKTVKLVKCEIIRKIFLDAGRNGETTPIAPYELSYDDLLENAKRKKAGRSDLIVPDKRFEKLPKEIAQKLSDAGAVKVAI